MEILGIDPRANSENKIEPPYPLPFISRRSLKRVKDRLPVPTACSYCSGEVKLASNEEIYGREYGDWPYCYMCTACRSHVGLHPKTDIPLGTLADASTREARKRAKAAFQEVTLFRFNRDRTAAYHWLGGLMKIDPRTCHFGMFTVRQCNQALGAIQKFKSTGSKS